MSKKKQQQLTLSSFFKPKTQQKDPEESTPPRPRTAASPAQEATPSLPAVDIEKYALGSHTDVAAIDETESELKVKRHARFVERFGQLQEKREEKRRRILHEGGGEGSEVPSSMPTTKDIGPGNVKWSPLELQVLELKERYPGVLLCIETGYKYQFFGDDAKVASRILHIAHFISRNFYVASVPFHRIDVHVRR